MGLSAKDVCDTCSGTSLCDNAILYMLSDVAYPLGDSCISRCIYDKKDIQKQKDFLRKWIKKRLYRWII